MTTKYEQVLKAVQTACPELMELSFGCDVYYGGRKRVFRIYTGVERQRFVLDEGREVVWTIDEEGKEFALPIKHIKILGHTSRLSHVLRAIGKANMEKEIYLNGVLQANITELQGDACDAYDLAKDDLSLQSEETINLLFDILCK